MDVKSEKFKTVWISINEDTSSAHLRSLRRSGAHTCPCRQLVSLQGFFHQHRAARPTLAAQPSLLTLGSLWGEWWRCLGEAAAGTAPPSDGSRAPPPTHQTNPRYVATYGTGSQVHELPYAVSRVHYTSHSKIIRNGLNRRLHKIQGITKALTMKHLRFSLPSFTKVLALHTRTINGWHRL